MEGLETPEALQCGYQKRKKKKKEMENTQYIGNDIELNHISVTGNY